MTTDFIQIGNGEAVTRDRIPHLAFNDFRSQALHIVANGGKVDRSAKTNSDRSAE